MKITLTNHEQMSLLIACAASNSPNSVKRAEAFEIAKQLGLLQKLMEAHCRGSLDLKQADIEKIPDLDIDLSGPELRRLTTFLDSVPTHGTNTFFLHVLTERLHKESSRNDP